jgi:DNA-binding transcriptional ArsR family regulator
MPKQLTGIDRVFQALADPTRRAVLERLCTGPASVGELAAPFSLALPTFTQHLDMLEDSGLVSSVKIGRVRTYKIEPAPLQDVQDWLQTQRAQWEQRLDQLDTYLSQLKEEP